MKNKPEDSAMVQRDRLTPENNTTYTFEGTPIVFGDAIKANKEQITEWLNGLDVKYNFKHVELPDMEIETTHEHVYNDKKVRVVNIKKVGHGSLIKKIVARRTNKLMLVAKGNIDGELVSKVTTANCRQIIKLKKGIDNPVTVLYKDGNRLGKRKSKKILEVINKTKPNKVMVYVVQKHLSVKHITSDTTSTIESTVEVYTPLAVPNPYIINQYK